MLLKYGMRFLTVVVTMISVFWDVVPCRHHHYQNSSFLAIIFLRSSVRLVCSIVNRLLSFHLFTFGNNNFCTEQGCQSCVQPLTWTTRSLYYASQYRVAHLYPQAPGFLSIVIYSLQDFNEGILDLIGI
jgi:hypothetical protein